MRLSEFLKQPDVRRARITIAGSVKLDDGKRYKMLAVEGQKILPIPKAFHLVPDEPDPELDEAEMATIRRRFRLGGSSFGPQQP